MSWFSRLRLAWMVVMLTAVCSAGCDLTTKAWARSRLSVARSNAVPLCVTTDNTSLAPQQRLTRPPRELLPELLELRYAENCGAAWSLFHGWSQQRKLPIFIIVGLVAVAFVVLTLRREQGGTRWLQIGSGLLLGGALGNLSDRIVRGFVTDFVHVHWRDRFDYPIFNVADMLIFAGMAMILIDGFRQRRAVPV